MARAARPQLGVPGLGAGRRPGAGAVPLAYFGAVFPAPPLALAPSLLSRLQPGDLLEAPFGRTLARSPSAGRERRDQARPPPAGAGGPFFLEPNFAARTAGPVGSPPPARRGCGAGTGSGRDAPRPNSRPLPGRYPSPPRGWSSRAGAGGGPGRAPPPPRRAPRPPARFNPSRPCPALPGPVGPASGRSAWSRASARFC